MTISMDTQSTRLPGSKGAGQNLDSVGCSASTKTPTYTTDVAPAPTLPLSLIDLILAFSPLASLETTTFLAAYNTLPAQLVPTAAACILSRAFTSAAANDSTQADPFLSVANLIKHSKRPKSTALMDVVGGILAPYLKLSSTSTKLCESVFGPLAQAGTLHIFKHLQRSGVPLIPHAQVIFAHAARGGHVNIMQWMFYEVDIEFQVDPIPCIKAGLEFGHEQVLHMFCDDKFEIDADEGYELAAKSGSIEALEWWRDVANTFPEKAWTAASAAGHVHVLDWAFNQGFAMPTYVIDEPVAEASKFGHVHVLDWWLQKKGTFPCPINAIHGATAQGHKHVLDWWAHSGLGMRFVQGTIEIARRHHNDAMNEYWTNNRMYQRMLNCNGKTEWPVTSTSQFDGLMHAAFGHVNSVAWTSRSFRDACGPARAVFEAELPNVAYYACAYGHLNVLEEITSRYGYVPAAKNYQLQIEKAAMGGQVAALQFMVVKFPRNVKMADWGKVATFAADRGHLCILDWMSANALIPQPPPASLLRAGAFGHAHVLEWLRIKGSDMSSQLGSVVLNAARGGHVSVLEWVVKHYRAQFPRSSTRPVDRASANGHWAVLEYLLYEPGVSFLWSEAAIRLAARNGHKRVAGWWLRSGLIKDSELIKVLNFALE